MDKKQSYEVVILSDIRTDDKEKNFKIITDLINDGKGIILQFDKSQIYSKDSEFIQFIKKNSEFKAKKISEKVYVIGNWD